MSNSMHMHKDMKSRNQEINYTGLTHLFICEFYPG